MSKDKFGVPDASGALTKPVQPKLGFKFRVFFIGMNGNVIDATRNIIDTTLPNFSQEEIIIDSYNSRYYVQGKHTFESITINFRNDIMGEVTNVLGQQVGKQFNVNDQSSSATAGANKFGIKIQALDGGAGDDSSPVILQTWHLTGCWVSAVNWGTMNYTDSNPVQISATIRYDNAYNIVLNMNGATDETAGQEFSNSIESLVNTSNYDKDDNTSAT